MTQSKKVDLLYKRVKHGYTFTAQEAAELRKYKVKGDDGTMLTKSNISKYVDAVDNGYRKAFYDFCMEKGLADRRYKGNDAKSIRNEEMARVVAVMGLGWLTWGICLYWLFPVKLTTGGAMIFGMIVSVILYKLNRMLAPFTCCLLPLMLVCMFA